MEIDSLITRLAYKFDGRQAKAYEASMQKLERQAWKTTGNLERTFDRSSSRINKLLRFSMKIHGIGAAKRELSSLDNAIGGLKKKLGALAVGYLGYNAAKSFIEQTFTATGEKQMQMARLETVLGSKSDAAKQYQMMAKFAEVTPYQKNDLLSGFSSIMGSGYKLSERDLTALGNVSAGSGKDSLAPMIEMLKSANRGLGNMVDNFDGMKATAKDGMLEMQRFDKQTKQWVTKTIAAGDMAAIVGFVREHGERNYQGQMDKMSRTLPGMVSTLKDKISQRFEDIGDAGLDKIFTRIMERSLELADALKPVAQRFGALAADYIPKMVSGMEKLAPLIKPVAVSLGIIGAHLVGVKMLAGFMAISGFVGKIAVFARTVIPLIPGLMLFVRTAGLGAIAMSGLSALAGAALPLIIAGAVASLVTLGWKLYQYWTQGDKALEGLRQKFPGLADSIKYLGDVTKEWWPHIIVAWQNIKQLAGAMWQDLKPIATDLFKNVLIPFLGWTIKRVADLFAGLKIIYEVAMPALVKAWYFWKDGIADFWEYVKPIVTWLFDKFTAIGQLTSAIGQAWSNTFGGGGDSGGGDSGGTGASLTDSGRMLVTAGNQTFQKDAGIAARLTQMGRTIYTGAGMCLKGVWLTHKAVLGTSSITALHAADAANQLASSKKFKEIVVTPEMYRRAMNGDLQMIKLLHGVTAIYNRNSGFSKKSGHAEIWDLVNKKALYGTGPASLVRSDNMIKNARFFLPISGTMPNANPAPTNNNAATVNQTFNFSGPTSPIQTRNAAQNGTTQALNQAGLTNRKAAAAR